MRRNRRLPILVALIMSAVVGMWADNVVYEATDTLTARDAFVRMPAKTLDLLTTSMRLDLLDYYDRADSIYSVPNAMEGLTHLIRPVSDEWIKAQITPVTTLTIRVLPYKKDLIALSIYTIGDSIQAADSEIRFYDAKMRELNAGKFIKALSSKDFFDFKDVDGKTRKELLDLVPFPTIEFYNEPGSPDLHARLTVGEFLGKETMEKITPYLRRDRVFKWTGSKYQLQP